MSPLRERQTTLRTSLTDLLAAAMDAVGASFGNVQVFNEKLQSLEIVVQIGFDNEFLRYFRFVGVNDGSACSRAFRQRGRVEISDVQDDPYFAPYLDVARATGFRAVQSTPIIGTPGSVLGILSTHFENANEMSSASAAAMDDIARDMARLIEMNVSGNDGLRL